MLRPANTSDFYFVYELYMHPQINPWLIYELMDKESFLPIFEELVAKKILFIYESNNEPAGMCKLVPQHHRVAHIVYLGGVAIHPVFRGQGHGLKMLEEVKEYLTQKGFLRIELSVAIINDKAIKLYEKAGFVKEGILKRYSYMKSENKFIDEVMMAYLV